MTIPKLRVGDTKMYFGPEIAAMENRAGHCEDCHWYLSNFGGSCRMILWGPRQPDIAKIATEVSMVASYSLKVHPTKFGCSLWRDENNSSTANSGT